MKKYHIYFNEIDIKPDFSYKKIARLIINIITEEENKQFNIVNLILCKDDYLLEINKKYLNHNTYTDVITFQYNNENEPVICDIFISLERIKENSQKFLTYPKNELLRVVIHGILHSIGYKDKTAKDKAIITQKEDYYLKKINL